MLHVSRHTSHALCRGSDFKILLAARCVRACMHARRVCVLQDRGCRRTFQSLSLSVSQSLSLSVSQSLSLSVSQSLSLSVSQSLSLSVSSSRADTHATCFTVYIIITYSYRLVAFETQRVCSSSAREYTTNGTRAAILMQHHGDRVTMMGSPLGLYDGTTSRPHEPTAGRRVVVSASGTKVARSIAASTASEFTTVSEGLVRADCCLAARQ
jgi:hypothetical protein